MIHYCFFTTGTWQHAASFVRLRELGRAMLDRGVRVSFIVDDIPYNRNELRLDPRANIHFTPHPESIRQLTARRKTIRGLNPDFVHVLNPSAKAFLALAGTGANVVGDWDEWPARRGLAPARKLREEFLDRWLRRRAAKIIVASRYLQQQFKQQFGLDATYIPYAAYLDNHADGDSPFAEPTFVYMGNFYPAYDHDLIFDAAKILKAQGRLPKIAMLGAGPDLEKWQAFVKQNELTNVKLAGYVAGPELWRCLRHAHVLLFPIRDILLNLCRCPSKTFAYAQARRPIITNRVGEVAEVLGEKAQYVSCTAQGFTDAIASAMSAPRPADIDYAIENATWSNRAEVLLSELKGMNHR